MEPIWPAPDDDTLAEIARRHGLSGPIARLNVRGAVNAVWQIGEHHILRIPRDEPICLAETAVEASVAPIATATGMLTPKRVGLDDRLDLVPVPYSVWERASGATFGSQCADPLVHDSVWHQVGAEIARFHQYQQPDPHLPLPEEGGGDPWKALASVRDTNLLREVPFRWFEQQLECLRPAFGAPLERVVLHDDLHAFNLLVNGDPDSPTLSAILDWGDAGWGDPSVEFVSIPLRAVPAAVEGYRTVRPLSDAAIGRILGGHLGVLLELLSLDPLPRHSWWAEFIRFTIERPRLFREWLPIPE